MSTFLAGLWRQGARVIIGAVVAFLVARGFDIPDDQRNALEAALWGAGVWAYGAVVHWLATRTGTTRGSKVARALARILQLGAPLPVTTVASTS